MVPTLNKLQLFLYKILIVTTILKNLEDIITMCTMSHKITKTKKCHSEARDRPDLIQTAPVPGGSLARKNTKINRTKNRKIPKSNYFSDVTLASQVKQKIKVSISNHPNDKWITDDLIKTKKCQPAVRDTLENGPHTAKAGVGVPDSGLARPQNKNKQNEKIKNHKTNYLSHVTLVSKTKHTKQFYQSQVSTKITKVSACCQGHTGNGPHPCGVGVGVPDGGLARPKSNYLSHVTLVGEVEDIKQCYQSQVSIKTKKCQPAVRDTLENGPHTAKAGVGVPDSGLARSNSNYLSHVTLAVKGHVYKTTVLRSQSSGHGAAVMTQPSGHGAAVMAVRSRLSGHSAAVIAIPPDLKSQVSTKTKKCQPAVRDTLENGPHTAQAGVGVPDSWLACPKTNYLSHVTLVKIVERTKSFSQLSVISFPSESYNYTSKYHSTVSRLTTVAYFHSSSRKKRNKSIKQINGNGRNSLLISHWNLGSKKWSNKRNLIQALVDQNSPDILFISEANLDESTPSYDSIISGYDITLPKTVTRNGTARLVLLTKENLDFELQENLMDDIFTSIWLNILRQGTKGFLVCGLYREHQYLNQLSDWSLQPLEQTRRWSHFLRQVETARISSICHIIGDCNLDYKKWDTPDFAHLQMITDTKNTLEAGGFFQMISEVTRS